MIALRSALVRCSRLDGKSRIRDMRAEPGAAAVLVEIHHLVERRVRTVVHVRRGERDVAERRHLERKAMLGDVIDARATGVGIETRVRERRDEWRRR